MPGAMLQVNFTLAVPPAQYEDAVTHIAEAFATVPGLRWKIWILNREAGEAGGVYHFESAAARDAFLAGPFAAKAYAAPVLRDPVIKRFDVLDVPTATTRGPVAVPGATGGSLPSALGAAEIIQAS